MRVAENTSSIQSGPRRRSIVLRVTAAVAATMGVFALGAGPAGAISANIHIHGTAPEGRVNIRPEPNTYRAPLGSIPEGASPDYNCFAYGQVIGGVPIWFSVNYNGVTGFYASYYDDSSYHSDAELTSKYGVPKCGSPPPTQPPPTQPPPTQPPPGQPPPTQPPPTEATQGLAPDPNIWCRGTAEHQWDVQVREARWAVGYSGLSGTHGHNDWRCRFIVVQKNGRGYTLPPVTRYINIDFAQMCEQQFPGSTLHWMLGPIYPTPWPWECRAPAGRYYPPPTLTVRRLMSVGGLEAKRIHARTEGRLSLSLTALRQGSALRRLAAAQKRTVTLARGERSVARPGFYNLPVELTPQGRALLADVKEKLRITFTLRLHSSDGKVQTTTTVIRIRRKLPPRELDGADASPSDDISGGDAWQSSDIGPGQSG